MKTECDYLNGWIKKRAHTQKSHPKVVNPRDIAGERKKQKNNNKKSHWYDSIRKKSTQRKRELNPGLEANALTTRPTRRSVFRENKDWWQERKIIRRTEPTMLPKVDLSPVIWLHPLLWNSMSLTLGSSFASTSTSMFQHDCLDTYCFWVSYMHAFSIFVFAPAQHNWACFTWKSALEIRSLSLLLLLLPLLFFLSVIVSIVFLHHVVLRFHCLSLLLAHSSACFPYPSSTSTTTQTQSVTTYIVAKVWQTQNLTSTVSRTVLAREWRRSHNHWIFGLRLSSAATTW